MTDQSQIYCPNCQKHVLAIRPSTNHVLHLLLTVLLCGWWLPVWLLMSVKIGGWRCSQCGYKRSEVLPMVAAVVCAIFGIVTGGMLLQRIRPSGSGENVAVTPSSSPTIGQEDAASNRAVAESADASTDEIKRDSTTDETATTSPVGSTLHEQASAEAVKKPVAKPTIPPTLSEPAKPSAPAKRALRTWTDATGKFSVVARLVKATSTEVELEREDGSRVTVARDRLSEADLKYIRSLTP